MKQIGGIRQITDERKNAKGRQLSYLPMILLFPVTAVARWSQIWIYRPQHFGVYTVAVQIGENRIKKLKYGFGGKSFNLKKF
ncbi:hypothetical protein SAMN05216302_102224 [Nitrosomonas aestuarii]|uniref:Uncharacterized protein n=1 Tax=Nitrosomonas aestuarii TaxID=52441 RepID=A0A1I4DQW8_9PROT|nr:hypothetical protein [Nitrosomonas aestuarii]SFK95040.1 hypothetical protein SAMN05216302_102224 [Nitrosomonas aestuarii]